MCPRLLTLSYPCHSTALAVHATYTKISTYCDEFKKKLLNIQIVIPNVRLFFANFVNVSKKLITKY